MAFAFRPPDQSRRVFVRLDAPLPALAAPHVSLVLGGVAYHLADAAPAGADLLVVTDRHFRMESVLLGGAEAIAHVAVAAAAGARPLLFERLTFHQTFFAPFFDFAREVDLYAASGAYEKPGLLAVFTHVYDDDDMLRIWQRHYAQLVPLSDLYVIDHGSTSSPRAVLAPEVTVVPALRGPVDHRAISQFCNMFQRFLLAQYRWVIHVDADELLVHARGAAHLVASLRDSTDAAIIKPGQGFHLVHDFGREPALDLSAPISGQRDRLVVDPSYAKPALASVPTTWREGFHSVLETHAVVTDDELWLVHLSYADLGLHLRKSQKWERLDVAEIDRLMSPLCYDRPAATVQKASAFFGAMLTQRPGITVPAWMRGAF